MKFVKVKVWTWEHFFSGKKSIQTELDATEEDVRNHIEKDTSLGGSGNYDKQSLKCEIVKIKANKVGLIFVKK